MNDKNTEKYGNNSRDARIDMWGWIGRGNEVTWGCFCNSVSFMIQSE